MLPIAKGLPNFTRGALQRPDQLTMLDTLAVFHNQAQEVAV